MKYMRRMVNTIFIMLGNGCNMNCVYCLQHPLVHHQIPGKINPEIYDFIRSVKEENGNNPLWLQFYGGEPLLYFENIRKIIEKTKDFGVNYSIITNGRAMTDEMVEFFNAMDMPVTISWDGPRVKETRGFDVFDERKPLRRRLLRLKQLGLSAVLSAKAYPKETLEAFQDISDQYWKLHGYQVRVNLDEIFDTGLPDKSLLDVDYERVEQEMTDMTVNYLKAVLSKKLERKNYTKDNYIGNLIGEVRNFCKGSGEYKRELCACGNGYRVLNLDLAGHLYPCHNTSENIGSIHDPYFTYLEKMLSGDTTRRHRKECETCEAVIFCQGGCKLVSDKARKESYCRMKRAVFVPVLRVMEELGKTVREAEYGSQRENQ